MLQLLVDLRGFVRLTSEEPAGSPNLAGFPDSAPERSVPHFLLLLLLFSLADFPPCTKPRAECVGHLSLDM